MKKNRLSSSCRYLLLISCVLTSIGSIAQQDILMNTKSVLIEKYDLQVDEIGWVYFRKKPPVNQLINEIIQDKAHLGLKSEDALITRSGTDLNLFGNNPQLLNKSPLRIKQTHNGLEVEGADVSIHFDGSHNVELMHGKVVKNLPSGGSVSLNEKTALQSALTHVGAKRYAWEDSGFEQGIKMDTEDPEATYYPVGKLMYAKVKHDNDFSASNYKLVYRFEIKTLEPSDQLEVMIDANSGDLIRKLTMIHMAWGTVNTLYNGQRGYTTDWRGFPNYDYVLKDTDRGDKLHTLLWDPTTHWSFRPEVDDDDNVWTRAAATTHWAVQVTWDYFITQHGRNGMDGAGGKIRIEAEGAIEDDAGYWRTGGYDYISFGRADQSSPNGSLAALDVVGHEFTHGVTAHASALGATGESGALHESFSDIFGTMVERSIQGTVDWVMGDDTGFRTRSLENPGATFPESPDVLPSPDTYLHGPWDFGGDKYRNCGVQNFWFWLLVNGHVGTNDIPQAYNVQGIGFVDAAKIAYKSVDLYIQSSSTYADARAAAINAATWWFGVCSNQVAQTMNAWHAVGVGNPAGTCPISGNITGPQVATYYQYCSWTMNPTGGNGVYTYQWQRSEDYGSTWWNVGTSKTYSAYAFNAGSATTHLKLRCTVSSGTQTQIFNHTVDCTDCPFGFSTLQTNPHETDLQNSTGQGEKQMANTFEENPKVLAVFPNPTSDRVSIGLFAVRREENLILIIDAMGNIVKRDLVSSEEHTMDAAHLLPGVYYVVVSNSAGRWVEKLIIKK